MIKIAVKAIKQENAETRSFYFDIPAGWTWEAGSDAHFGHLNCMRSGKADKALVRHMSITTLPEEGQIGFTTRVPGSGSTYKQKLAQLKTGDALLIYKLGNRIPLRREQRPVIFISMGVGAATVRPLLLSRQKNPAGVPFVINLIVDRPDHCVFQDEFKAAAKNGLTNIFCANRTELYTSLASLPYESRPVFYIIGSDPFLENVIQTLQSKGVSARNMELDKKPQKKAEMLGTV